MFLKNKNIIFENRRSKVTDYAALMLKIESGNERTDRQARGRVKNAQTQILNEKHIIAF